MASWIRHEYHVAHEQCTAHASRFVTRRIASKSRRDLDLRVFIQLWSGNEHVLDIASNIANAATFPWILPLDLDIDAYPDFRILVGAVNSQSDQDQPISGQSEHFRIERPMPLGRRGLVLTAPAYGQTIYPDQVLSMSWSKGSLMPELPNGIQLELRSRNGPAVLSVASGVKWNEDQFSGSFSWRVDVPAAVVGHEADTFEGDVVAWGYDVTSKRLVYASKPVLLDLRDRFPLQLRFLSPQTTTVWQWRSYEDVILQLARSDNLKVIEERPVRISLHLYDEANRLRTTFAKDVDIPVDQWVGGAHALRIQLPSHLPDEPPAVMSHDGQTPFQAQAQGMRFRLVCQATYQGVDRSKSFPLELKSELLTIVDAPEQYKEPGSASTLSSSLWLLVLVWSILFILYE